MPAELDDQHGSELPAREAISLVFGAVRLPTPLVAEGHAAAAAQPAVDAAAATDAASR